MLYVSRPTFYVPGLPSHVSRLTILLISVVIFSCNPNKEEDTIKTSWIKILLQLEQKNDAASAIALRALCKGQADSTLVESIRNYTIAQTNRLQYLDAPTPELVQQTATRSAELANNLAKIIGAITYNQDQNEGLKNEINHLRGSENRLEVLIRQYNEVCLKAGRQELYYKGQ
jgi:hypothetical protein